MGQGYFSKIKKDKERRGKPRNTWAMAHPEEFKRIVEKVWRDIKRHYGEE